MKKIAILLPLLLCMALLQGCHSSSTNNQSSVRLVNGASTPLDMYWSGSGSASAVVSTIDYGTASSSVSITAGISSISLAQAGGTPSAGINVSFGAGYSYTVVAYPSYSSGPSGQISTLTAQYIIDDQTQPVSGNGLIGVADYSGAGSLDVYMGENGTTPTLWKAGISGSTLYFTEPVPNSIKQNYHIQITGAGAGYNNDVRLDIPSVTIGNQQILTLVLTPTIGGGLVDGLVVLQQGQTLLTGQSAVTPFKNYSARVRLVANYDSTIGTVTSATTGGGISLASNVSSPNVGSYAVVPLTSGAASTPLTITLNVSSGGPVMNFTGTAIPGQDLTLLAYGNAATSPTLLVDDNTLASSGYAKLRMVNGINGIASGISLSYGGVAVQNAQNVALGTASTAASVLIPGGSPNALGVGGAAFNPVSPNLQPGQGVFSLFMLGDTTAVSGVFSSDHSFQGP